MPRALILAPQRRLIVSSIPITTSPAGRKASIVRPSAPPAQHLVVACKARFRRQPHDPQRLAYRALAWRQNRSGNKHENVAPNGSCEAVAERGQANGKKNLRYDR